MPKTLQGWTEKKKTLSKTFAFADFPSAIAFMVEVGLFCEKTNHHPDWKNSYDKISVSLSTHDAGGVTAKDKKLAAHMDKVFGQRAH